MLLKAGSARILGIPVSVHKSEPKEHYYNQVAVFIRLLGKVYYYIYKGDSVELSFISFT